MNRIIEDVRRQRILSIDGQMRPYLVAQRIFVIVAQTTHLGVDFIYFFHFGFIRSHSIVHFVFFWFFVVCMLVTGTTYHTSKIQTRNKNNNSLSLDTVSAVRLIFEPIMCVYVY